MDIDLHLRLFFDVIFYLFYLFGFLLSILPLNANETRSYNGQASINFLSEKTS